MNTALIIATAALLLYPTPTCVWFTSMPAIPPAISLRKPWPTSTLVPRVYCVCLSSWPRHVRSSGASYTFSDTTNASTLPIPVMLAHNGSLYGIDMKHLGFGDRPQISDRWHPHLLPSTLHSPVDNTDPFNCRTANASVPSDTGCISAQHFNPTVSTWSTSGLETALAISLFDRCCHFPLPSSHLRPESCPLVIPIAQ